MINTMNSVLQRDRLPALVVVLVLLAGCAAEEDTAEAEKSGDASSSMTVPGSAGQTFVYECDDGSSFTARVEGEKAWLFLASGSTSLPHVPAASGAKFSDGTVTYWSKGESAMFERPDHQRTECTNNRRKAIWEDARLRGADFRAVGNEPGWNLEISRENGIEFVNNYGSERYTFPMVEPVSDQASRTTIYQTKEGSHELEIVLEGKACADTMSGEQLETSVTIRFDGTSLNGCGRSLQ